MKFLVTGGAGFIGSNIVSSLVKNGYQVRVIDNLSTGKIQNIEAWLGNKDFQMFQADIRDLKKVKEAAEGVDYILHQAALPSVPRSIKAPLISNEVNISGTLNILEAAKELGVKRVVYASSSSIYGDTEVLPKVENMPVNPLSPYALTKYAGEKYCQQYNHFYGLETVVLRYFNVFGPNQNPDSEYSAVIPKFIKAISENKRPIIYGDGSQSRDFTYVYNNVQANINACFAENVAGKVFNIAAGKRYSLIELVNALNKLMHKKIEPEFINERKGDIKHSLADIKLAEEKLSYKVQCSFEEGLEKTATYFMSKMSAKLSE